jgi:hypothetical protein
VIHHEPTETADPEAYRRANDRRMRLGPVDSAVRAAPVGGVAATETGASAGDGSSGFGGWERAPGATEAGAAAAAEAEAAEEGGWGRRLRKAAGEGG